MCFISPKNVERKLENKEKKSNSKDSVTKLCFETYHFSFTTYKSLPKRPETSYKEDFGLKSVIL